MNLFGVMYESKEVVIVARSKQTALFPLRCEHAGIRE